MDSDDSGSEMDAADLDPWAWHVFKPSRYYESCLNEIPPDEAKRLRDEDRRLALLLGIAIHEAESHLPVPIAPEEASHGAFHTPTS